MPNAVQLLQQRLMQLEDRIAIQDRIWAALNFSDLGDWVGAAACYTSDATVDLVGYDASIWPEPLGMPITDFRRRASTFMPGFSVRQHMVTNFSITTDGNKATSVSQVRAIHVMDNAVWEAFANYRHHLRREEDGWKIDKLHGTIIHQTGAELIEAARRRVAAQG